MKGEIRLRIRVVDPPRGATFCLQRGRGDLVPAVATTESELIFDLTLRVEPHPDGVRPNFLGPFSQGPRDARFVYVNSGTLAGQAGSCWTRRAKVSLFPITLALVEEALHSPDRVLEARIAGRAKDGGPACATVPLLDGGWRLVRFSGV